MSRMLLIIERSNVNHAFGGMKMSVNLNENKMKLEDKKQ